MDALFDLPGSGVGSDQVALPAFARLRQAAVPTALRIVLLPVDADGRAVRDRRDVHQLGLAAERTRPVIVAAEERRTHLFERFVGIEVADAGIGLDLFRGIVIERLAGLLVDALGPV